MVDSEQCATYQKNDLKVPMQWTTLSNPIILFKDEKSFYDPGIIDYRKSIVSIK